MAIIVRHRTLSQKTQTASPGIISKNEWNDIHIVDSPNEAEIIWDGATGHNHDGDKGTPVVKALNIKDVTGTSPSVVSGYNTASSTPVANQIPILDSNAYLNLKQVGTSSYIQFYETSNVRAQVGFDFNNNSIRIKNSTGSNILHLYDNGIIDLISTNTEDIRLTSSSNIVTLYSTNTPDGNISTAKYQFRNVSKYYGWVYSNYTNVASSIGITATKFATTQPAANIECKGDGNVSIFAGQSGTTGKAYYSKITESLVPNNEITTVGEVNVIMKTAGEFSPDITGTSGIFYNTSSTFVVPANVRKILVQLKGGGGSGGHGGTQGVGWQNGGGGGGGGGEGATMLVLLEVIPGETFSYTIGNGGVSNTNGGNTQFGTFVCYGGATGATPGWSTAGVSGGVGGAGGYELQKLPVAGASGGAPSNSPGRGSSGTYGSSGGASIDWTVIQTLRTTYNSNIVRVDGKRIWYATIVGRSGGYGGNGGWYSIGGGGGGAGPTAGAGGAATVVGSVGTLGCGGGGGGGGWDESVYGGGSGGKGFIIIYY